MSSKEARRVYVIERAIDGGLTVKQAAEVLGLSERQVKRLKKGMKQEGVSALAHHNRGRTPKHTIPEDVRVKVVALATGIYKDASSAHMSELLEKYQDIRISHQTIRRILRVSGVPLSHAKKGRRGRKTRDRAPKEGLLLQTDASPFDWLEDRGPRLSLHGNIDDATSKILGLCFRPTEDLKGYFEALRQTVSRHGIPRAVYSDGHSIFFSPAKDKLTVEEELAGKQVALTQFGRALDQLGVTHIHARSPQAKGRIERLWGTLQSRLVIELRLACISTMDEANAFLPGFIDRFNERFAVEPADPAPAYMPLSSGTDLDAILCVKETRTATNGSVISYHGQTYRLLNQKQQATPLPPRAKVEVLLHLDSTLDAFYQGQRYILQAFTLQKPEPKQKEPVQRKPVGRKPSPDNPWLKFTLQRPSQDPVESYFRKHENKHLSTLS